MFRFLNIFKLEFLPNYMKIIRERSRTYKGKDYYKYKVNIPEIILKQAKLKAGDELEVNMEYETIILKKRQN